jgi:hypothetical protein
MLIKTILSSVLVALFAFVDGLSEGVLAEIEDVTAPQEPTLAKPWYPDTGYDCKHTCENHGGTENQGYSPASWGVWGDRLVTLCLAKQAGQFTYGWNLVARQGSNVDSDVCVVGGANKQLNIPDFFCRCLD